MPTKYDRPKPACLIKGLREYEKTNPIEFKKYYKKLKEVYHVTRVSTGEDPHKFSIAEVHQTAIQIMWDKYKDHSIL